MYELVQMYSSNHMRLKRKKNGISRDASLWSLCLSRNGTRCLIIINRGELDDSSFVYVWDF